MRYKVVIIGAGPGGTYTALSLAKLGVSCLLIDKSTFPRTKACGDILTSNVLRALHGLDEGMVSDLLAQPWVLPLQTTSFVSPLGDQVVMPFHSPSNSEKGLPSCLSAPRQEFDFFLLEHAKRNPLVEVKEGVWVKAIRPSEGGYSIEVEDGKFEAEYVVLACGGNSRLVKELLPGHEITPQHTAVGYRMYFQGVESSGAGQSEFYLFDEGKMPGGLYLTPFSGGLVNLNLVMRYDVYTQHREPLPQLMERYIQAQPKLAGRFVNAVALEGGEGSTLFFGTKQRPLSGEGLLLVGDAAGLTDATNANGIGHAMLSGGIAATTILEAMTAGERSGKWMKRYDKRVKKRLANALFPGKVMQVLFGNRWLKPMANRILVGSFKRLNQQAIGELVYSSHAALTLVNPRFYIRLFSKGKS